MDNQDCIKLEAVSFKTPGEPRVTFGLDLPDGQSISVALTVTPPGRSVVFTSYDQIIDSARLELSRWLDEMARHARSRPSSVG